MVKRGRSLEKRFGVIFVCLTIRAVQIEMIQNLGTDSFIISLIRFMARRGKPEMMCSDNGTNLMSGDKEIREAILQWNGAQMTNFSSNKMSSRYSTQHLHLTWVTFGNVQL